MQFLATIYGLLSSKSNCIYAFPEDVSFSKSAGWLTAYRAVFTIGDGLQANTVSGVASGKRFASNLKFAFSALDLSNNPPLHTGIAAEGSSTGNSQANMSFYKSETMFIAGTSGADSENRIWNFGRIKGNGSSSRTVSVVATVQYLYDNGTKTFSYTPNWIATTNTPVYLQINAEINFMYFRTSAFRASSGVIGAAVDSSKMSEMLLWSATSEPDNVVQPDCYECVLSDGHLVRYTAEDISFGQLVAGTRPKVQSYLTSKFDL